jgi:hypothetical protein
MNNKHDLLRTIVGEISMLADTRQLVTAVDAAETKATLVKTCAANCTRACGFDALIALLNKSVRRQARGPIVHIDSITTTQYIALVGQF